MKSNFKNSRNNSPILLLTSFLIFFCTLADAQVINTDSLGIGSIRYATTDIYGNLYLSDSRGQILKVVFQPCQVFRYSGKQALSYDKIDADSFNKIAAFSRDLQSVRFFDRNLNPLSDLDLNTGIVSQAAMVCFSSDNNLWIYDENSLSLIKSDLRSGRTLLDIPCGTVLNGTGNIITDMKEYGNRLYLLNNDSTVFVWDNMGNYLKKIKVYKCPYLQFLHNNIISMKGRLACFINVYNGSEFSRPLNIHDPSDNVIMTDKNFYILSDPVRVEKLPDDFFSEEGDKK